MKKNNKGFMLVEVIISTVVVATVMTSLYVAFNKVYNYYELKESYTNVDAIYAIKTIEDYLIDTDNLNVKLKGLTVGNLYQEIPKGATGSITYKIFNEYKINKMYLIKVKGDGSEISKPGGISQTFVEYIDYLNDAVIDLNQQTYLFVVETYESASDKNILNKYAYLEVK